jgi:hypothetical protein
MPETQANKLTKSNNNDINKLCFMLIHPFVLIFILETISIILSLSDIGLGAYYTQNIADFTNDADKCKLAPIPQLLIGLGIINLISGLLISEKYCSFQIYIIGFGKLTVLGLSLAICAILAHNKANLDYCPSSVIKYTIAVSIYRIIYYLAISIVLLIVNINDINRDSSGQTQTKTKSSPSNQIETLV